MFLVCPTLEYVSACWDHCIGQINALDRVQKKVIHFTVHKKESDWENLILCGTIAVCAHFLKLTVRNGVGKRYETGCERLTV